MTESLATILSQTFEKDVFEEDVEVTECDPNDSNLSNFSQHEQEASQDSTSKHPSPSRRVDVDATVNDLLTNVKESATEKQSNGVSLLGDFLETVKNDQKSETGPLIHEELAKIVTRLVRDGMLEEKLQEKLISTRNRKTVKV